MIAIEDLELNASNGDAKAQCRLGLLYYLGHLIDRDDRNAFYWYQKAATQGYAEAQFNLGEMYENSRGVEYNLESAHFWYQKAAESEDYKRKSLKYNDNSFSYTGYKEDYIKMWPDGYPAAHLALERL